MNWPTRAVPGGKAAPAVAGSFISSFGNGMFTPFIPVWLIHSGSKPAAVAGELAIFALVRIFGGLAGGLLADYLKIRWVIGAGAIASTLGSLCFYSEANSNILLAGLLLIGVGALSGPAISKLVVGCVEREELPRVFGSLYAANNLGMALGALFATATVSLNMSRDLLICVNAVSYIIFWILLGKLKPVEAMNNSRRRAVSGSRHPEFPGWKVGLTCAGYFLVSACGFSQQESGLSIRATVSDFEIAKVFGLAWSVNCIAVVVAQQQGIRLCERFGARCGMWSGGIFMSIAMFVAGLGIESRHLAAIVISLGVFAFGEVLISPSIGVLVNRFSSDQARGQSNALLSAASGAGRLVGPYIASAGNLSAGRWTLFVCLGVLAGGMLAGMPDRSPSES